MLNSPFAVPVLVGLLVLTTAACGSKESDGSDQVPIDATMQLGQTLSVQLDPFDGTHYSYSLEIPPRNGERYYAEMVMSPTVAGNKFRARLTNNCSWHAGESDELSSSTSPDGIIRFQLSAQYSSEFVQLVGDEPDPFELTLDLHEIPPF